MSKPLLLGMNNPQGNEAFWPYPKGCTGWRIWKMLESQTGISDREFIRSFDRMNMLNLPEWSMTLARQNRELIMPKLMGREVVVVGYDTFRAMEFPPPPRPFLWGKVSGIRYCLMPHPSGLNRMYNDPATVMTACLLLAELYTRFRRAYPKQTPRVIDDEREDDGQRASGGGSGS